MNKLKKEGVNNEQPNKENKPSQKPYNFQYSKLQMLTDIYIESVKKLNKCSTSKEKAMSCRLHMDMLREKKKAHKDRMSADEKRKLDREYKTSKIFKEYFENL